MRRLECGRLLWPAPGVLTVTPAQIGYLLSGLDGPNPIEAWRPARRGLIAAAARYPEPVRPSPMSWPPCAAPSAASRLWRHPVAAGLERNLAFACRPRGRCPLPRRLIGQGRVQLSICPDRIRASSTAMPRCRASLSSFVCPSGSWHSPQHRAMRPEAACGVRNCGRLHAAALACDRFGRIPKTAARSVLARLIHEGGGFGVASVA